MSENTTRVTDKLDRIDAKLDALREDINALHLDHATRITRLETSQKGVATILMMLITGLGAYFANLLNIKG